MTNKNSSKKESDSGKDEIRAEYGTELLKTFVCRIIIFLLLQRSFLLPLPSTEVGVGWIGYKMEVLENNDQKVFFCNDGVRGEHGITL